MKSAEEFALQIARELAMDSAHIPAIKSVLVPHCRQIQADALRQAVQKLHDETYAGMTRIFIERILIEEANQLDPIPTNQTKP